MNTQYPVIGARSAMPEEVARFWSHVQKDESSGCWMWVSCRSREGYGTFRFRGRDRKAHRFAYEMAKGVIRWTIDHLCGNESCVNPDHLEDVPIRVNVLRGNGRVARQARQTHCLRGHALPESNGRRRCRECIRINCREKYWLNRDEIRAYRKAWYASKKGKKC